MHIKSELIYFRYGNAVIAFAAAFAIRVQLVGVLPPDKFPFLTFFPAVLLVTYFAGIGPGLLVSGLSVLAAWRFLVEYGGSFPIPSFGDQVALLFFGTILVLDCLIIQLLHNASEKARMYSDQAKRLVQQSRRNELIMDAIFEAMPTAIIVADKDGKPIRTNTETQRLWGQAPDTSSVNDYAQWKGWWADGSARHGQQFQAHEWGLARAVAGEINTQMVEIEPFGRPGERVMTLLSAAPVRDKLTGEVSGGVVTQIDMTESFKAQHALRESEAKFHALADNIPQLAWMAEADGALTWYNNRWLEYTGATIDEMQGSGWQKAHHPDYIGPATEKYLKHIRSGLSWEDTFPLKGRDGNYRWFLSRAVPIRDESGKVLNWFGTNTDVTEQRKAEEDLRLANRRKDDFLAMLAHELRNPLAPIVAAAELLSIAPLDAALIGRTSDMIGRQARHLSSLVDDLLDVSRVRRGLITLQRTHSSVQSLLSEAIEQAHPAINARAHTLTCRMAQTDIWINADAKRLIQVFANILINAAKYTPEGGRIEVLLDANESEVNVAVQDNGIGMQSELLSNAFELFSQAERSPDRMQGGLGIGLALVKSLVEMHDGVVVASSAGPGLGCRFDVKLPRLKAPSTSTASKKAPLIAAHRQLHVLIVDDNADAAWVLATCLEGEGHEVTVCHTPTQALERAALGRPDACLLDIGLPEMDGCELVRRLRELPGMQAVLMAAVSGYSDQQIKQKANDAGFDHYFVKPVHIQQIIDLLTQAYPRINTPDDAGNI